MTDEQTRDYIARHANDDVRELALNGGGLRRGRSKEDDGVDMAFALQQIAGRQRARTKLPTWAATEGITYPPQLSMEQCSSEQTARYKAEIAERLLAESNEDSSGTTTMADLTGGFGVDFWQLSQRFDRATYVEQDAQLCAISSENFRLLGLHNVDTLCADGTQFLRDSEHLSLVYLDPARRGSHGQRTYSMVDCTPDVLTLRDVLHEKADMVMLKLSPMLDWRKAVDDLGREWVKEVHIVSVGNECKELLLVASTRSPYEKLRLVCINDGQMFESSALLQHCCSKGDESLVAASRQGDHPTSPSGVVCPGLSTTPLTPPRPCSSLPLRGAERGWRAGGRRPMSYLYEPNASIMKAGCFEEVAQAFGVSQIAPNSHLFAASERIDGFPGRSFTVEAVSTMNRRELKPLIGHLKQANITVRNFPMSVDSLRKRLKIGEGGSTYIFATTLAKNEHVLIFCKKV